MTHLREQWQGVCLSGTYTLEQWLGGDDTAAFFQTAPAPDGPDSPAKSSRAGDADSAKCTAHAP